MNALQTIAAAMRARARRRGHAQRQLRKGLQLALSCIRGDAGGCSWVLSISRPEMVPSELEVQIVRAAFGVPAHVRSTWERGVCTLRWCAGADASDRPDLVSFTVPAGLLLNVQRYLADAQRLTLAGDAARAALELGLARNLMANHARLRWEEALTPAERDLVSGEPIRDVEAEVG